MLPRCADHPPKGQKYDYVAAVEPLGYPKTAIRCGRGSCSRPALAYLNLEEYFNYETAKQAMVVTPPRLQRVRIKIAPDTIHWRGENKLEGLNLGEKEEWKNNLD